MDTLILKVTYQIYLDSLWISYCDTTENRSDMSIRTKHQVYHLNDRSKTVLNQDQPILPLDIFLIPSCCYGFPNSGQRIKASCSYF